MSERTDWHAWHRDYDNPESNLSRRRRSVQQQVETWLETRPDERLRVVSACSGNGRDLLEVLARRPDAHRVLARLLEMDDALAASAQRYAAEHGIDGIDVRREDAGHTDSYRDAVPADLVMMCGVFGNLTDSDLRATVGVLPRMCAPGATVLWTRGRFSSGDLSGTVREWFAEEGFEEVAFEAPEDATYRVGAHRLRVAPQPLGPGRRFFRFTR